MILHRILLEIANGDGRSRTEAHNIGSETGVTRA
jgi:hypothetical protein